MSGSGTTRRREPQGRDARLFAISRFLLRFNVYAIPLYAVILSAYQSEQMIAATADLVDIFLSAAGVDFTRNGLLFSVPVQYGSWAAVINWDCVGWKSLLAVFALVMATDYPMRKKLKGLAVLLPAVYIANILRIVFLIWYAWAFDIAYFAIVHAVLWSWGMVLIVTVSWASWLRTAR